MLENFSTKAGKYIALAESIAFDLGHCNVGSEHLLLGFLKLKDNKLKKELDKYSLGYEEVKKELLSLFPVNETLPFYMEYTDNLKDILSNAEKMSRNLNEDKVSEGVLMFSLIEKEETLTREILLKYTVDVECLKKVLKVNKICLLDSVDELTNLNKKMMESPTKVYKRENELNLIENTLLKRQKANVLLVGNPGVGKSALVEHLAYKITKGEVKEELKDKIIYELDMSLAVAGTKYRGEFEDKINKILKKVKDDKNAIIFIDEIHNIIGAGGAEGAIDASNILKPYLSRKDITCIGATTMEEYSKFIEKEKAIDRRFMTIFLDEISVLDTKEVLINLKSDYESYHGVKISKNICDLVVDLLDKHVKEKHFPDKALDLLDYACVLTKNSNKKEISKNEIKEALKQLHKVDLDKKNIFYLNKKLKEKIIGQNNVIDCISKHLSLIDLKENNKPLGVYLFLGDSGVGKTELAKEIANHYFKENAYIKIDMESYSDPSSVSKLLGSNPGYVGYDNDSYLLDKLRSNPSSVVILDEIEKASKEVISLFLNAFDEGYLIDSKKRRIDFSNAIIIMTSNLGFNEINNHMGFNKSQKNKEEIDKLVRRFFNEDLLNRVDEIFFFNKLEKQDYSLIAKNYLKEKDIELNINTLLDNKEIKGVRELKKLLKNEIAKEFLKENNETSKVS